MRPLPTGTVTFLFTDVAGSSQLWEQHPEAMQAVLAAHDAILRQAVAAHAGQIVKTTGDGIHAVFETAVSGLLAAVEAQQRLHAETWEAIQPQRVRVRMGLHTGTAEARAGDYYGPALNRAARLMSLGYGGQILLSHSAAELLREGLPAELSLRDLGEHRLKDLSRPEHIYQLVHPGLPADFPALQSFDSIPNNLPIQLTSFVGRENEIAEIVHLLDEARLVTLTGSGGTGKTRLALESGAQVLDHFPQGVWLVELAPLGKPSQILPTLAQIFGLQETNFTPLDVLVREYLRGKKALILLDNCEHLVEACAQIANDLLHACPQLKIIASSREALGIAGEIAYRIPSLAESEAVLLFMERAHSANPKFHPTPTSQPAIASICARLDGIPLAIELAAARVRLLSPEQIATRLDDRFRLLVGGSRTALARQQTLRALIDWSYELLSPAEKRCLQITSVFAGGWSLEALEAVASEAAPAENAEGEPTGPFELLEQLVNKSLVVVEEHGPEMRYSLLETIRQYAREKLFDAGADEVLKVRNRHLEVYRALTQTLEPDVTGPAMIEAIDQLEVEQDNLRAALEWALDHDVLAALQISTVMAQLWGSRTSVAEGIIWMKTVLARAETGHPREKDPVFIEAKAKTLAGAASLALQIGDNSSARTAIEASATLARQIQATHTLAYALSLGATIFGFEGDVKTGFSWADESLTLSHQNGYLYEQAMAAGSMIFLPIVAGQSAQPDAAAAAAKYLQMARAAGNPFVLAMAISNIGRVLSHLGDWDEASARFEEAAALYEKMKNRSMVNNCRSELGHVYRKQGRYAEALALYRETILTFQEFGQFAAVAHELECIAFIAQAQNQPERAATLLGAAEALREQIDSEMIQMERLEYEAVLNPLRVQLGESALAKSWAAGRAMELKQAIELAVE